MHAKVALVHAVKVKVKVKIPVKVNVYQVTQSRSAIKDEGCELGGHKT
jgi:hypothetical protein